MASTRSTLEQITNHLDESLGVRGPQARPILSPVPAGKDKGRRPERQFGSLEIEQVMPDPTQPRSEFSGEAIEQLATSIVDRGQLNPIRVRWSEFDRKWVIISGERRYRATVAAGLSRIQCYFHEGALSESEILEEQIIENCIREDLQPSEEARAFRALMELNGYNAKQLADALRVSPSKVSRTLALLKLPEDIQQQVDSGELAPRSAYELSKLDNPDTQRAIAQDTSKSKSHQQVASAVRQRAGKPKARSAGSRQTFATETGWSVVLSAKHRGNYHEIEQALTEALEEVQLRIENNVQLY